MAHSTRSRRARARAASRAAHEDRHVHEARHARLVPEGPATRDRTELTLQLQRIAAEVAHLRDELADVAAEIAAADDTPAPGAVPAGPDAPEHAPQTRPAGAQWRPTPTPQPWARHAS